MEGQMRVKHYMPYLRKILHQLTAFANP